MLDLEGKVILGGDLLEAIRSDKECPGKTKTLICRWLEKWIHNIPYHRHYVDANELAMLFQDGTKIKVRMRFADDAYTEAHWNENYGPWDGVYHGITRGVVGDCTVESGSIFIPAKYGIKADYDVEFTVFEPKFSEKLRRKWAEEDGKKDKD